MKHVVRFSLLAAASLPLLAQAQQDIRIWPPQAERKPQPQQSPPPQQTQAQQTQAQQTPLVQQAPQAQAADFGIDGVIKMVQAGLSDEVIIASLKQQGKTFNLSTQELVNLKAAHVSDNVLKVMLEPHAEPGQPIAAGRLSTPAANAPASTAPGAHKEEKKVRNWQTGRVLDTQRQRYFAGSVSNSNSSGNVDGDSGNYHGSTSGSQIAVYRVYETFVIEGDQYVYLAQEHLKWRWSKPASVTVNGPVKYIVDKRRLIVLDEDSKEHEMEIIKKTIR